MISTITQRIVYSGNGATVNFAVPFRYDDKSWIRAYLGGTLQTLDTHYTLTTAGQDNGGTLTFLTAPATGTDNVVIIRATPITNVEQLPSEGPFASITLERLMIDKLVMMVQDIYEILGRTLLFPVTETWRNITLPDPESGKLLSWNADLTAIINAAVGSLAITSPIVVVAISASATTATIPHSLNSASAKLIGYSTTWFTNVKIISQTLTEIVVEFSDPAPGAGGTFTAEVTL
jgi:Phage T7 tail fibre protein